MNENIEDILDDKTIEDFRNNRFNEHDTFLDQLQEFADILKRNGYSIVRDEDF